MPSCISFIEMVSVVVGGARQNGAAPSIAAGVAGTFDFDLGNNVSMKTSGLISRIHTRDRGGICHQLANDGKVRWVK